MEKFKTAVYIITNNMHLAAFFIAANISLD